MDRYEVERGVINKRAALGSSARSDWPHCRPALTLSRNSVIASETSPMRLS